LGSKELFLSWSGQKVDWARVAAVRGLNNEKWKVLVKDAKLYAKKLIAILDRGPQPLPALPKRRSSRPTCTPFSFL
jgi:hypothetical protein